MISIIIGAVIVGFLFPEIIVAVTKVPIPIVQNFLYGLAFGLIAYGVLSV